MGAWRKVHDNAHAPQFGACSTDIVYPLSLAEIFGSFPTTEDTTELRVEKRFLASERFAVAPRAKVGH